jgi:hypothetical protein
VHTFIRFVHGLSAQIGRTNASAAHSPSQGMCCAVSNRAFLVCAAFMLARTNACAAGFFSLELEGLCKIMANLANKTYGGSVSHSFYPARCYWHAVTDTVYFNTHEFGADNVFAQSICAGAADFCGACSARGCTLLATGLRRGFSAPAANPPSFHVLPSFHPTHPSLYIRSLSLCVSVHDLSRLMWCEPSMQVLANVIAAPAPTPPTFSNGMPIPE